MKIIQYFIITLFIISCQPSTLSKIEIDSINNVSKEENQLITIYSMIINDSIYVKIEHVPDYTIIVTKINGKNIDCDKIFLLKQLPDSIKYEK